MSWFSDLIKWAKARLHVKDHELRGAPGVSDPALAAAVVNGLVGTLIDSQAASLAAKVPAVGDSTRAVTILPEHLAGKPGIDDHVAAAEHINGLLAAKTDAITKGAV